MEFKEHASCNEDESGRQSAYFDEIEVVEGQSFIVWMRNKSKQRYKAFEITENGTVIGKRINTNEISIKENSVETQLNDTRKSIEFIEKTLMTKITNLEEQISSLNDVLRHLKEEIETDRKNNNAFKESLSPFFDMKSAPNMHWLREPKSFIGIVKKMDAFDYHNLAKIKDMKSY
jgi:hypothetical protein